LEKEAIETMMTELNLYASMHATYLENLIETTDMVQQIQQFF